ncbi:S-layer homology domain-containing protein [Heyndrickxia sporothermodurans]|uniref:S-layer homology domain-containing protein n=1 Tax=Heyndrickxia sporothermodurans TaxID=46224 RepID=UPI002DB7CDC9|nr:S-layer homology domain-containing protein [Heyndrickxia sporothermodurans]MEB6549257.1 S-layer homology domain-containing protein [Heyndrickxia sporothermodurans]
MTKKKKRNALFVATLAAAVAIPSAVAPVHSEAAKENNDSKELQVVNVKATSPFKDVSKSHWAYEAIHDMRDQGIINGYPDGTFRPSENITRKHVAALLDRALPLEPVRKAKEFKDVPKSHPYHDVIQKVQMAGIIDGDEKGNFNPEAPLTRVQMAKVLDLAFGLEVKADYDFPDVPTTHWGNKHVRALYSNGIAMGDGGYYKPNNPVTRAHYAAFLQRLMNLDEDFEAKPIEPVKPEPKPEPKPKPTPKPEQPKPDKPVDPKPETPSKGSTGIKYTDVNHYNDIPRPSGYVPGEHTKKQNEIVEKIMSENGHGFRSAFSIREAAYPEGYSLEDRVRSAASTIGLTTDEFVRIINQVIDTGEVYNGKTFTVFFDFNKGQVNTSGVRNHAV